MTTASYISVNDRTGPRSGLILTWLHLKRDSDGSSVTPPPAIVEWGNGQYRIAYNPDIDGPAVGKIDAGDSIEGPGRWIDVIFTAESSRILGGIASNGRTSPGIDTPGFANLLGLASATANDTTGLRSLGAKLTTMLEVDPADSTKSRFTAAALRS